MVFDRKEHRKRPEVRAREKEWCKEYNQRPEVKARSKEWHTEYQKKPEVKVRRKDSDKKSRHKPENKARKKEYEKQRRTNNLNFSLLCKLRTALGRAFKHYSKTGKINSSKKYGINYNAIIKHLKPFPKDIENYHVDHRIPLSLFDFNNSEQIKIAFLPENHQWLTKEQNLWKSNRLIVPCAFE